jgi:sugar transport protein
MFYVSYGTSFIKGTASFRLAWGLQMIPAILLFIGLLFLPESPRWLARKERYEEAHHILAVVHGKGDPNHPWVLKEFEEIKADAEMERANADVTYWELLKPKYINQTHIAVRVYHVVLSKSCSHCLLGIYANLESTYCKYRMTKSPY